MKGRLIALLGLMMLSQLALISLGVVECVIFAKNHPAMTRPQCQKIDVTLQEAVNQYIALILALMVPLRSDAP